MIMAGTTIGRGSYERTSTKNDKRGMMEAAALGRAIVRRIQSYKILK